MIRGLRALVLVGGSSLCACSFSAGETAPDASGAGSEPDAAVAIDTSPLVIDSLGVQGFVLRRGGDTVMTAPLFTRQSAFEVGLGLPLDADTAAIDAGIASVDLSEIRAIVSGHAHYDHFIDVPHLLERIPGIPAYTNLSGRHMLAALAPDRPGCGNAQPTPMMRAAA